EDRVDVPRQLLLLLPGRGVARHLHPERAGTSRRAVLRRRPVQSALHHARDDDDLPLRHPDPAGFANYIVPLQIGALDMAFPRVNALSLWMLPLGGALLYAGYLMPGGTAKAGWTHYAPIAERTDGIGTDLWIIALLLIGTSSILGAVNFITTIFKMRAP